jgi:hypothetical protein
MVAELLKFVPYAIKYLFILLSSARLQGEVLFDARKSAGQMLKRMGINTCETGIKSFKRMRFN